MNALIRLEARLAALLTQDRFLALFALVARLAIGTAFLSSVADRLGWWGDYAPASISWGGFALFEDYTADVLPYVPGALIPAAAWASTVAELVLGVTLVLGLFTRLSALLSALLLFWFAVSLGFALDWVKPLSFSVFSASAAGLLLAVLPRHAYAWSLDHLLSPKERPGTAPRLAT